MTDRINSRTTKAKQLRLPLLADDQAVSNNGTSYFNDPAFASNKSLPIHRWVPWIAGFSSDFVYDVLQRYANGKSTVLDPFAGVGTTLVEATLFGCDAVGFEINPYAALASRVKVSLHDIDTQILDKYKSQFKQFYDQQLLSDYVPKSSPPKGFRTRSAFYSPQVLHKVLILLDFINLIEDATIGELFKLAFASTMVSYSNYSYEPSLGRRISAGKDEIVDYPVGETIVRKLAEMSQDIKWFQANNIRRTEVKIIQSSFFDCNKYISPQSIDLIITSPPYLNNYHYNRNTRPHLYWLGYAEQPNDLKVLEATNFGKYWQTVREKDKVDFEFSLMNSDLAQKVEALRAQKPERGIYGGNGWANYAVSYFNDCHKFSLGIEYALKPGGTAIVVIGNSILQGISIPTDQYFGQVAESVGLELVRIDVPRATRVGNSIIQSEVRTVKAKKSQRLYEAIVELRKV